MKCQWRLDRGYWAGDICGCVAAGEVEIDGRTVPLCHVHLGIAVTALRHGGGLCWSEGPRFDGCISRHGQRRTRHKVPLCKNCGGPVDGKVEG